MKKTGISGVKRSSRIMPNERRRQLWRRHRMRLIERRSKWFHQFDSESNETEPSDSEI